MVSVSPCFRKIEFLKMILFNMEFAVIFRNIFLRKFPYGHNLDAPKFRICLEKSGQVILCDIRM